jgi:hypothetical protein
MNLLTPTFTGCDGAIPSIRHHPADEERKEFWVIEIRHEGKVSAAAKMIFTDARSLVRFCALLDQAKEHLDLDFPAEQL